MHSGEGGCSPVRPNRGLLLRAPTVGTCYGHLLGLGGLKGSSGERPAAAGCPCGGWQGTVLFDKFCKWPMQYDDVWKFMTELNEVSTTLYSQNALASALRVPAEGFPAEPWFHRPLPALLSLYH